MFLSQNFFVFEVQLRSQILEGFDLRFSQNKYQPHYLSYSYDCSAHCSVVWKNVLQMLLYPSKSE